MDVSTDRRNNIQINYNYDIPGPAKALGIKGLGYITDHWSLSGITSFQSGAPYSPSCSLASGSANITGGYSWTPDLAASNATSAIRCQVLGNPLANLPGNGNGQVYFNATAFGMPALPTGPNNSIVGPPALGNLGGGSGVLSLPHVTNFDMTLSKNIPLGSEKRVLRFQAQAYNLFNHTEISGIGTSAQYSPTTNLVTNGSTLGYVSGALPNRVMAFSVRLQF